MEDEGLGNEGALKARAATDRRRRKAQAMGRLIAGMTIIGIGLAIAGAWALGVAPPTWMLIAGAAVVALGGLRWAIGNDR